ncbi:ribonuclease HI [Thermodesulfobacteriota bacterium]
MADSKEMKDVPASWERRRFKNNKVWLAIDPCGHPIVKDGKVLIKYQVDQDYEYWVHEKSVRPLETSTSEKEKPKEEAEGHSNAVGKHETEPDLELPPGDAVCIYSDGASSGNPGPSGIGVLLQYGEHEKEMSKYIGVATNNIAELEAIRTGLLELKKIDLPIRIFTDSEYAYGVLVRGWKTRKNQELIASIKEIMSKFKDLKIIKVKGHAGIEGNERADRLATSAIKNRE